MHASLLMCLLHISAGSPRRTPSHPSAPPGKPSFCFPPEPSVFSRPALRRGQYRFCFCEREAPTQICSFSPSRQLNAPVPHRRLLFPGLVLSWESLPWRQLQLTVQSETPFAAVFSVRSFELSLLSKTSDDGSPTFSNPLWQNDTPPAGERRHHSSRDARLTFAPFLCLILRFAGKKDFFLFVFPPGGRKSGRSLKSSGCSHLETAISSWLSPIPSLPPIGAV